jgi:hypothetical protein
MAPQNRVRTLVGKLLYGGPECIHQQTVKINERHHHMLKELVGLSDTNKTTLASQLLEAAIEDAVEALPDDKSAGSGRLVAGVSVSLREQVKRQAEAAYRDFLEHRGFENNAPDEFYGLSLSAQLDDKAIAAMEQEGK